MATNETYRNAQGTKVTDTQWHNLVAFGKVADIAEKFLDKGTEVALEGKLVNRNYTDKDGVKRYVTEIHVSELLLLGSHAAKTVTESWFSILYRGSKQAAPVAIFTKIEKTFAGPIA